MRWGAPFDVLADDRPGELADRQNDAAADEEACGVTSLLLRKGG